MAFFQLVLKANKLEKLRQSYEDEKLTSIEISKGIVKPVYTLKQQIRRRKIWFKKKVTHLLGKIFAILRDSWMYKKIVVIRTDGTLENYIAKSFAGFVGGIFLTYIFFIFFVFQLHFKLSSATFLCTIIGIILTLGLAFSFQVRCVVFLLLPQFFSKRGRQALMAYAFILALTGPVKNTMHNTGVLSESLACAQEQLKEAVKTVIDLAKQPFYALREAISKVIKTVKVVVKKIKQTLIAIKRVVLSILRVITAVFEWLGSIISICNKKLGTPFDRCQSVFEGAVADCKAKLGPIFGLVCNITYVVSSLCYIVKPLDFICMLVSYIADSVVGVVKSKIKKFTMHMKAMFYVKVKFSHSFHFETNQSRTMQDVSTSITTEIRSRTDKLFGFFDFMNFITSFFMFFIILRVLRYRYKWLTSERFDNRYITDDLRTIDLIRTHQDKETVLPLNRRERNKYVPLSSVILIKSERTKLSKSIIFLSLATVKLITYMLIDYCLYWVLNTIQLYGRFQSKVERPNVVTIHVSGDGYLADLYKSIVKAFTPHGQGTEIDTMLCLPDPVTPDFDKYTQILVLIFLCWLMAFFEPYGLRMRQVVMCQYYPERAKQRAAWLYNYIIRSRGNFLKFARRQLRRKFGLTEGEKIEKVTLKEKLWAMFPLLNIFFPLKQKACLLCGTVERDEDPHVKCPTPGCIGLYCTQCFADLQNLCTICRSPMDYGDLSDMSEENPSNIRDSSEDQFEIPRRALLKRELKLEEEKDKIMDEEGKMMGEEYEAMLGEEYETEEEEMLNKEYGVEDEEMPGEEYEVEDEEMMGEEYETEDEEMLGEEYGDEEILDTEYEGEEILGERYENGSEIGGEEEEEEEERAMEMIAKKEGKIEDKEEVKAKKEKEENKLRVEQPEKMEKDVGEQTDDKSLEDLDQSTEYSYTYQDESPEEVEMEKTRKRFKDVEAQKIRDDVTIQIFNQPLVKESISDSESPTSGFVVRARRKVRGKLKKRPVIELRDSDSSSSIADTESWPSEDVDEEEVIHIEIDGDSEELLPKDRKHRRKLGRINRIVDAVARIPWLGKGEV
ncbi:DC-STAMP domain-containing protein 2-like [Bombus pascuorum]|uniref:DC-STAMP domain-containing protein 2-like n=1 Tax=Bombus pascuorum TaxID=65598 RepID=UPI00298E0AAB|nr:DC-STAMP domain-containing protein 2-like [Bombus pascuorum]